MAMNTSTSNEIKHLLQSYVKGDQNSFELFYKLVYNDLWLYGIQYIRHEQGLRDTLQEFFFTVLSNASPFANAKNSKAYLFKAYRNALIKSKNNSPQIIELLQSIEKTDTCSNPEVKFILKENQDIQQEIKTILFKSLSKKEKEIIFLRYYEDLSYKEIASAIEIQEQVARNLAYRGIKKLRKLCQNQDHLFHQLSRQIGFSLLLYIGYYEF